MSGNYRRRDTCVPGRGGQALYDCKSDPKAKVIPEITRTGPLTICRTRLPVLLYHARY